VRQRSERRGANVGSLVLVAGVTGVFASMRVLDAYGLFVLALVGTRIIAALSLNVLMGYAGQVSLGQAAFVGVGAFSAAQLAEWAPFPIPLVAAVVVGAAVATVVGLPSLRIRGLQVAATTLAFGVAVGGTVFARPWAGSSSSGLALTRPVLLRGNMSFAVAVWTAVAVVILADGALRGSRLGRAFTAVRDREDNAAAWGIAVNRTKLVAYAVSGAYAGLAGGLFAYLLQRVTPGPFDVWASLLLVAAAVIGGQGSVAGVAVAAAALAALPELLRSLQVWAPLFGALMLVVVPTVRPEGLGWVLDRPLPWPGSRTRAGRRTDPNLRQPGSPLAVLACPVRPLSVALPTRPLLAVHELGVRFGGVVALDEVSVSVGRHEVVGLIGPNGAGKSTLFNCVSGLTRPSAGNVRYHGIDLLGQPPSARQGLGLARTFQQVGLCLPQTVWENVMIAQHPYRGDREAAARAREALELMSLDQVADTTVGDLAHGQQRLVEIAAALSTRPDLLLLDEPAAGLNSEEAAALVDRIAELRARLDLSLLLIEHHLPVIMSLCDHVYVLAEGRVIAEGTPERVQEDPVVTSAYLGTRVRSEVARHAS
jgi:branched-chain amino acid transport system ATP-binding protein/branched-chain amino acid transport system permease protein